MHCGRHKSGGLLAAVPGRLVQLAEMGVDAFAHSHRTVRANPDRWRHMLRARPNNAWELSCDPAGFCIKNLVRGRFGTRGRLVDEHYKPRRCHLGNQLRHQRVTSLLPVSGTLCASASLINVW